MKPQKFFILVASFLAVTLLSSALETPPAYAISRGEARCRIDIAASSRKWLDQTMKARQACLARILRGVVPSATTDCIAGDGDRTLAAALDVIDARLSRRIPRHCEGTQLMNLGFPGQCTDPTPEDGFNSRDLDQCIRDTGNSVVTQLLGVEYPPSFGFTKGPRAQCIARVGKKAFGMFAKGLKARHLCLLAQDAGRLGSDVDCRADLPPYGGGTTFPPVDRKLQSAYVTLLSSLVHVCATSNVDEIGFGQNCPDNTGGDFTLFDLKNCNFDLNRALLPTFLAVAFPTDPVCGNGIREGVDEECDNGDANADTGDACRTDCTNPACGDTILDPAAGEECDDGNTANLDGCSAECEIELCGDGVIAPPEECDDGDSNSNTVPNACRLDCTNPVCGDNVTDPANLEDCDDGNLASSDGCSGSSDPRGACKLEFCGDAVTQASEQCDDGVAGNSNSTPDACRTNCQNAFCGDGVTDPGNGEECDDGKNGDDTDGCSDLCTVCGNGKVTAPEECDDGASNSDSTPNACRTTCTLAGCGDGVVDDNEVCDDGDSNSDVAPDACRTNCVNAFCGDSVTDPMAGEECDDGIIGNSDTTPDACRSNCALPNCGDGVVDPSNSEVCDGLGTGACAANEGCVDECGTCQNLCPGFGELVLYAATGGPCTTNGDCAIGECDPESLHCKTLTDLDSGWVGLGHDSDINDASATRGFLDCPGAGPVCGECNLAGIDPVLDNCRCNGDPRTICDEPFQADDDDCGGAVCNCFFGAPFPLSSSGVPACVVNRFAEDVTGTVNVDTGDGETSASLRTSVFLGESTVQPCPYCGGVCENVPGRECAGDGDCGVCSGTQTACTLDTDCVGRGAETCVFGTCDGDDVFGDGQRDGVCVDGTHDGLSCDVQAINTSFPVRPGIEGGGGYSLDCMPSGGKNVSGAGLVLNITQSTGRQELEAQIQCSGGSADLCHCKVCSSDNSVPCSSNEECFPLGGSCSIVGNASCLSNADCASVDAGICAGIGRCLGAFSKTCTTNEDCQGINGGTCNPSTCTAISVGEVPDPNGCSDGNCVDLGGGNAECAAGPDDRGCDGCVKANGDAVLSCNADVDCGRSAVGNACGNCGITKRRKCFLDTIVSEGVADPVAPLAGGVFCIPPTSSSGINVVAGLPGPARVRNQGLTRTFCKADSSVEYIPGVGGCAPE